MSWFESEDFKKFAKNFLNGEAMQKQSRALQKKQDRRLRRAKMIDRAVGWIIFAVGIFMIWAASNSIFN
jgi:hypothetical protein